MLIIAINKYDWGHCLPDIEKGKLALALEETSRKLKPQEPKSEVIIIQTEEDFLE
jgi:hypothetical protein